MPTSTLDAQVFDESNKLIIGRVNGVYGVKGWVKVFSYTEPLGNILSYNPWWVKQADQWVAMNVIDSQSPQGGKAIVAQLDCIKTREQARDLMGAEIAVMREQLPDEKDSVYWTDLIGCEVRLANDQVLGKITELIETGGHDVMRVKSSGQQYLIPFVEGVYVLNVDLINRVIQVEWQIDEDD
jgi:16S rRNA processing protein RimM